MNRRSRLSRRSKLGRNIMFQGIIILWHHRLIPNGIYRCRSTKGVIRHPGISYSYFSGAVAKLVLCDGEAVCVSTVWILILFNSGKRADWLVFFLYDSLNQVALAASFSDLFLATNTFMHSSFSAFSARIPQQPYYPALVPSRYC